MNPALVGVVAMLLGGCARHHPEPLDRLPFAFEARLSEGEIWVVPPLVMHAPIEMERSMFLGATLPPLQQSMRRQRTRELTSLPHAIAKALPGAVNARLGERWQGQFRHRSEGLQGHSHRIAEAIRHDRPDLHAVLGSFARAFGDWVLLTWVTHLESEPLLHRAWPGEVVHTNSGSVVVDFDDDPHLVKATVGVALLSPDGEVVVRYEDVFEAVLTGHEAHHRAARQLADSLASEVTMVWATDRRFAIGSL